MQVKIDVQGTAWNIERPWEKKNAQQECFVLFLKVGKEFKNRSHGSKGSKWKSWGG
jgi:hypothetical protein